MKKASRISENMGRIRWKSALGYSRMMIAAMILGLWGVSSCTYDKGEVVEPISLEFCDSIKQADSLAVTYTCDVQPIIAANCTAGCHKPATPQGTPVVLDTYDLVVDVASDSRLTCVINWTGGCSNMPYLSAKIDSLDIVTIQEWINQGTPE